MREGDGDTRLLELALKAKYGDQHALETLLVDPDLKNVIYGLANNMVGQENADDIYQEVCLRITQNLRTWQEKAKFTTWISKITINRCINFRNKREQEKKREEEWTRIHTEDQRASQQQLRDAVDQERKEFIRQVLEEMGEPCKRIMTLYFFQGLRKKKIMEVVNVQKSAFHERWRKCYNTLWQKIQKII